MRRRKKKAKSLVPLDAGESSRASRHGWKNSLQGCGGVGGRWEDASVFEFVRVKGEKKKHAEMNH